MAGGLSGYFQRINQWFSRTADRALDEAYKAALKIESIEDEHFDGQKVYTTPGNSASDYLLADLNKYLNIARLRLAEFQTSRPLRANEAGIDHSGDIAAEAEILAKLELIDNVLGRYRNEVSTLARTQPPADLPAANQTVFTSFSSPPAPKSSKKSSKLIDPSIVNTFRKISQELNPKAEQEMVTTFRSAQNRTVDSLRFLLFIMLVPLVVHFISKFIFFGPIIDIYYPQVHTENIFLNRSLEREAMERMEQYERHLRFQSMTGLAPKLSSQAIEARMEAKAQEIRQSFTRQSSNAVKNWFADGAAVIAFYLALTRSKAQITNFLEFIDSLVSGLSDTAKAFGIILFTDTFVGFHSPHGWEVVLTGLADHLGIPDNQSFNSLFIATFPVLLDTIFKYWIFRYLSGQSPSSVATYKTMNE
jgi:CemA family